VSNSKKQFEPGFVVSAICVIHVVCVALLVGMTSSTAAQIAPAAVACTTTSAPALDFGVPSAQAPNVSKAAIIEIQCSSATPYKISLDAQTAAGASVVLRQLSDRDASANYLLYFDGEPANTANNTVVPSGNRPDTVRVTVTY
jgi:spore coat protein U-like protein